MVLLVIFCILMGNFNVYAENYEWREDIAYGEYKTLTVPVPDKEVDEGDVYLTQYYIFTPEVEGTYRFLVSYEEDPSDPYDIFMDVSAEDGYWELENGCEFNGKAGVSYELMFQYNSHDGRYPTFTFYVGGEDLEKIPETGDVLPVTASFLLLSVALLAVSVSRRKDLLS